MEIVSATGIICGVTATTNALLQMFESSLATPCYVQLYRGQFGWRMEYLRESIELYGTVGDSERGKVEPRQFLKFYSQVKTMSQESSSLSL